MALTHLFIYAPNSSTGKPLNGAVVRIYSNPGNVLQTVYRDRAGTVKALVETGADGEPGPGAADVYIEQGDYDIEFVVGGQIIERLIDVPVYGSTASTIEFGAFGEVIAARDTAADARADLGINSAAELAADGTKLGFTQSGTGSALRDIQAKARERLSTADKTGTFLEQLQSAETDINAGGICYIPRGTNSLSATFTADGQRMNIEGDGRNVSLVTFNPASADVALEYNNVSAGGMYQGSIGHLGFNSGNAVDKTAIRLVNCADADVSHIGISAGAWLGSGSIGVEVLGRQSLHFHTSQIGCARPLVVRKNPLYSTLNTDHFIIGGGGVLELTTTETTGSAIFIDPDVMLTTAEFSHLALTGGKYGIYWNETTSGGASYGMVINKLRREQATDATGYSIYLALASRFLQSLKVTDSYLDSNQNGIYLKDVLKVTIENTIFAMAAGTALEMVFAPGSVLILNNCQFQAGAAITLTNAKLVYRSRLGASAAQRGAYEIWVYEAPADLNDPKTGATLFGGIITSEDVVLADGATVALSTNEFTGRVWINSSVGTGAEFYLAGTNNVTSERDDPYGQYSGAVGTATMSNVYWDAGTTRYRLQNLTGSSKTYTINLMGRAV